MLPISQLICTFVSLFQHSYAIHVHVFGGSQVSKPVIDDVLNCLRIEVSDITITLSAR